MPTPRTRAPLRPPEIPLGNPWEAWRLGWMASELWISSTRDLMGRGHWLTPTDPDQAAAQRAWQRRWSAKALAGLEAAMQVQRAGFDLWFVHLNPWHSHREAPPPVAQRRADRAYRLPRPDWADA